MDELLAALAFLVLILAPCIAAASCASERRMIRKVPNRCPDVDRRDPR